MIDVGLVYFKSVTLDHLDAAWYSLSRQDFTGVRQVLLLDNDTADPPPAIQRVIDSYPLPVPVGFVSYRHGDRTRTQSWSVNRVMVHLNDAPWVFFTRADYLLDFTCLQRFRERSLDGDDFVTSFAYHMAYDARGDQRIEGFRDIEPTGWRQQGVQVLLQQVNGWQVETSHLDAGVWLLRHAFWKQVGGLDERLSAWGYQQTVFQKALRAAGARIHQIPEYLFFHQHHAAPRSYDIAKEQLLATGLTVEELQTFRPDVATHAGSVCDELDKP